MLTGQIDYCHGRYIAGWVLPEQPGQHRRIVVSDESGNAVASGLAAEPRSDLATLGQGRIDFGFRIAVPPSVGAGPLRVFADDKELFGSPLFVGASVFDGHMTIQGGVVSGWVSSREAESATPPVALYDQDARRVAVVQTERDPVADDPLFWPARFCLDLPAACFGRSELHLLAVVEGAGDTPPFARATGAAELRGFIDTASETVCAGWVFSPDVPSRRFDVAVYRDGELAGTASNSLERGDVRASHPSVDRCGFDLTLPPRREPVSGLTHISVRLVGSDRELLGGPFLIGSRAQAMQDAYHAASLVHRSGVVRDTGASLLRQALGDWLRSGRGGSGEIRLPARPLQLPAPTTRRMTIVVPVYSDVDATRVCLESVLRERRQGNDSIVIINDNPGNEAIASLVDAQAVHPDVFILRNARNEGFIGAVNRGMDFAKAGDVLLLNADTELYAGALDEMHRVLHADPDIGTVTAMSNNATLFSYPHPTLIDQTLDDIGWPDLAAVALRDNAGKTVAIPTAHGFCMLIRRETIDEIGLMDPDFGRGYGEENDFSLRAADRGWRHVAAGGVLVRHVEAVSFGHAKQSMVERNLRILGQRYPEYADRIDLFASDDTMRSLRWALDLERIKRCVASGTGLELVIQNGMDGGTQLAASDIDSVVRADGLRSLRLTAKPDGSLHLRLDGIRLLAVFQPREAAALFGLLGELPLQRIVIHHLLGFDQDFARRLSDFIPDRHSVFHIHDFYAVCPRVTLIDATDGFCGGAAADRCDRCVAMGGAHLAHRLDLPVADHRALFQRVLSRTTHVVAPSEDTAERLAALMPGIRPVAVPHPQTGTTFPIGVRRGSTTDICLLGGIGPHKGSATLLALARHAWLNHPNLRFHLVGHTDIDKALLAVGNVTIHGRYDRDELPGLVEATDSRIALFLHGWPETFSYTLTEAVSLGLIPVVPDIGAPAERVRASGFGVVFPFPIEIEPLMKVLIGVANGSIGHSRDGALPLGYDTGDSQPRLRALYRRGEVPAAAAVAVRAKRRRSAGP